MSVPARAILALNLFFATTAFADGILISWSGRDLKGASQASFDAAKKLTQAEILKGNEAVSTWPQAYELLIGANEHRDDKSLIVGLIEQLTNKSERKLADTSRLIIWERITSGDIVFEGKGLQVYDDLFLVAGRANWMLRHLTERNFGYVTARTSKADLEQIQARWRQWAGGEQVADYRSDYETKEKGLEEIRSPEALEALIVSLRPSQTRDTLMASCLRNVYNLQALPEDASHPAQFCNPDTYTHRYLSALTEITDPHDGAWWDKWWAANAAALEWDSETGKFRAKKP